MGAWGTAAWENDLAADWFADLFEATKLAKRVEKTLNRKDIEEHAPEIRAAASLLIALGHVYVWPNELKQHLKLAIAKLEAIRTLEDYRGMTELDSEIAELRARLEPLGGEDDDSTRLGQKALNDLRGDNPSLRLKALDWIAGACVDRAPGVKDWLANPEAMEPIIQALDDSDLELANEAAVALSWISARYYQDRRAIPGLIRLLKRHPNPSKAAQVFGMLGSDDSLPQILPLLTDDAANVRVAAMEALAYACTPEVIGHPGAVRAKPLTARGKQRIRRAALPILQESDDRVRIAAVNLFYEVGDRSVLEPLKIALRKERNAYARDTLKAAIKRIKER